MQPVRNAVPLAHSARPTENGFNFTPEMHGNPQKDCSAFSRDQTFRFVAAFRTHGQKHPDAVKTGRDHGPTSSYPEFRLSCIYDQALPVRQRENRRRASGRLRDGFPFQNFHFEESEQVT